MKNKIQIIFIFFLCLSLNSTIAMNLTIVFGKSKSVIHNEKIIKTAKTHFTNRNIPKFKKVLRRAEGEHKSTRRGAIFELEAAIESEKKFNENVEGFELAFCFYENINHGDKEKTEQRIPQARLEGMLIDLPNTEYDVITSFRPLNEDLENSCGYLIECKSGKGEPQNKDQLQKQYNVSCWFKEIQKALKNGRTEVEISIQKNQKGIPLLRLKGEATCNQEIFVLCNWIKKNTDNSLEKWNKIINLVGNRTIALLTRGPISEKFSNRLPFYCFCRGDSYFSPRSSPFKFIYEDQQG